MVDQVELLSVPVIDIGVLLNSTSAEQVENFHSLELQVLNKIGAACEQWGFFYVVNHEIDAKFMEKVVRLGKEFFMQPKQLKEIVARKTGNFQGYSDSELTKQKTDWKQIFDYSAEDLEQSDLDKSPNFGIHGVNQWPEDPSGFKDAMVEYFQKMRIMARTIMEAVLKTLSTEVGIVEKCFADGGDTSFCRLNFYPVCPTPEKNLGVGPHSDAGILTVLYQDGNVSSLQVEKNGKFYDVPPVPHSFVINIGDMTQVWSNGKYKAPVHRVLANHSKSRFSIPFFLNPSYSCIVDPLAQCISSENPKMYKPISWGEFRKGRVEGDYADVGEEIQISHFEIK